MGTETENQALREQALSEKATGYLCRPSFRPYLQVLFLTVAEQIPVTSKDMESGMKT